MRLLQPSTWLTFLCVLALGIASRAASPPSSLSAEVKEATKDVAAWVSLKGGFKNDFRKASDSLKPYVGKIIAMQGSVRVQQMAPDPYLNQPALILEDRLDLDAVELTFYFDKKLHDQVRMLSNGQRVTLKGMLTERGDVKDATIVAAQDNPGVRITMEELAAEMDRNPLRLRRLLEHRSIIADCEVAEMKIKGGGDYIKVVMPEKSGAKEKRTLTARIMVDIGLGPDTPVDFHVGERVTLKGSLETEWIGKGDDSRWVFEIGYATCWPKFPEGTKFLKWSDVSKMPPGVLKVKLADMAKDFDKYNDKAIEKFQGRMLELTGTIEQITKKEKPLTDAPVVAMRFEALGSQRTILCHFKPALAARVAKLKTGQAITVRGEMEFGKVLDNGIFNGDLVKD